MIIRWWTSSDVELDMNSDDDNSVADPDYVCEKPSEEEDEEEEDTI